MNASMQAALIFRQIVENNKGWQTIQKASSAEREKAAQNLFFHCNWYFFLSSNLDFSREVNVGPGFVDFKISRGNDKTVIEMKLSSNDQYIHGYEKQIWRYAQAENTEKMVYILIDVGNEERVEKLRKMHEQRLTEGKESPILVIIDAKPQKSASKC